MSEGIAGVHVDKCCMCDEDATRQQLWTGLWFCDDDGCFNEYKKASSDKSHDKHEHIVNLINTAKPLHMRCMENQ